MPLLTVSTPLERTSFAFPCESTFHESHDDRRREVATCSLITTSGALRCNFLKLNKEVRSNVTRVSNEESSGKTTADEESFDLGVRAALSMLKFYKREISPLLPLSCRYVPTCSVYSMEAYKRYGVVKGTILTAWRLCRCNPLGGHGFDPPRWFGEEKPSDEC
ncbi:uncharacterized protein LOC110036095 isoform X2 [Phalaenopsis equestris]|uniref:uncharacterized protein LOC110036095 isoform X2 n=1 Tax=Phalaenopsis equestris TaxID=78828 RepID=UPI0009E1D2E0|nr:uncharacterized protein LOC110036095 isoform X2 [Phalaenopsis equestris]